MTEDLRVVIADDHPVVREGLAALLSTLPGISVVGLASNGKEAIRAAVAEQPHVLVMDLHMPEVDGFAAIREIARVAPQVAILVLTMLSDDDSVFAAIRAGARGYVLKGAHQEEISRALRSVAAGEAIFSPGVATRILDLFSGRRSAPEAPFPELTSREREVLDLVATDISNVAIASRLGMAPKTVANHLSSIFAKLRVADRAQAVVRARQEGLGR